MNYVIALIDVFGFVATIAALIFWIRGLKTPLARDVRIIIMLAVAATLVRNLANVLEWSHITFSFDPIEDNIELLLPIFWGFVVYAFLQDLDRKARADLNHALAMKNKELQSVVYIASHDLRSPLVNIRGFSNELAAGCARLKELLERPHPDENIRDQIKVILSQELPESLGFIESGVTSMDRIIDGLLRLSRAGSEEVEIRPLDLNRLVLSIRQAVNFQIEQKNTVFTLGDLPPCMGDENQIAQVFSNLIDNALKYLDETRPGQITVTGWYEHDRAVYCVKDNGIGIAPADHEKVFEVFCRLRPDRSAPGEGLGLNIVSRILERHNGSIRLESELGRGSAFYVSLPKT